MTPSRTCGHAPGSASPAFSAWPSWAPSITLHRAAGGTANRADLVQHLQQLQGRPHRKGVEVIEGQLALPLGDVELKNLKGGLPAPTLVENVRAELDLLAVDVSGHLMESHRPLLDRLGVTTADKLLGLRNGTEVLVAGVRVATQTPPMRGGRRVVFISIDDGTGCVDSVFFHEAQEQSGPLLFGTRLLLIRGNHPADRAAGHQHQRLPGLGPQPNGDPALPCDCPRRARRAGSAGVAGTRRARPAGRDRAEPGHHRAGRLTAGRPRWLAHPEPDSMDEAGCGPRTPQATKPKTVNRRHPCQMPSRSPFSSTAKRPR